MCDPDQMSPRHKYMVVYDWILELSKMEDKYKFIVFGSDLWESISEHFIDSRRNGYQCNGLFGRVDGVKLYSAEFFKPADMHKARLSIDEFPKRNEMIPGLILNSKNFRYIK